MKKFCYCTQCNCEWDDNGEDYCPDCHSMLIMEECPEQEYTDYERQIAALDALNCDGQSDYWIEEYPEHDFGPP